MAYTVTPLGFAGALKILRDTALGATADNNLNDGKAVLHHVYVDNTAAGGVTYVKLYNNFAPTIGTTDPGLVLMVPAGGRQNAIFVTGCVFSTAISAAAVTAGGTGGTSSPSGNVLVDLVVA